MATPDPDTYYAWRGITADGVRKSGVKRSRHVGALYAWFAEEKITPYEIKPRARHALSARAVTHLIEQLAMLLSAGLSLIDALRLLSKQTTEADSDTNLNKRIRRRDNILYAEICTDVEEGLSLSDSLKPRLRKTEHLTAKLIEIGEVSGTLNEVLTMVADNRAKQARLRKMLTQASIYPAIICTTALAVLVLMLTHIVPAFETLYAQNNSALPEYTQLTMTLSAYVNAYGGPVALIVLLLAVGISYLVKTNARAQKYMSRILNSLPFVGGLRRAFMTKQFSATLALSYRAGMPINDAIKHIQPLFTDALCCEALKKIAVQIEQGVYLHVAVANTNYFPPLFTRLLRIGETCGKVSEALNKLEQHYEDQLETLSKRIVQMIEPCLIIFVALLVCWIVVSMYAPIFSLGTSI